MAGQKIIVAGAGLAGLAAAYELEHTELVAPGMEGALTSGKRAAMEIIKAGYN